MSTTTLLQIRNAAKQEADMSGSLGVDSFIPDLEWNQLINSSLAELHDIIVQNNVRYYLTSSVFTVSTNASTQPLPTDFYKIDGLDKSWDGSGGAQSWYSVPMFQWRDRNRGNSPLYAFFWQPLVAYNVVGGNLVLQPASAGTGTYQLWYYPKAPTLVADTDVIFDDLNFWYEFAVVDVAIKARDKEESDVTVLLQRKEALKARVEAMSADRDMMAPERFGRRDGDWAGWGPWGGDGGYGGGAW